MAVVDEDIWPLPPTRETVVDQSQQQTYGDFVKLGPVMMRDEWEEVWAQINEKYGTNAQLPPE